MTRRLGISISASAVRGVLVRAGRVTWHAGAPVEHDDVDAALTALLERVPLGRFSKPRAVIAVGLAYSQLKPIDGLPSAASFTVLNRVVRENSESFFLSSGRRLFVTDVDRRSDGTVWAAAFNPQAIDGALAALRRHGVTAVVALPSVAAFAAIVPAGTYRLSEGRLVAEVATAADGRIANLRRVVGQGAGVGIPLPAALETLGPDAADYLTAFGAARAPTKPAFVWRPAPSAHRSRAIARARVGVAALLLTSSLAGALVAPGARTVRAARAADHESLATRTERAKAIAIDAELRRVTTRLEQIGNFASTRGAVTLLLGEIARALPESTALLNIRIDSLEGSFIALSPHVADILPQLAEVSGVVAPRIVGSVTREGQGPIHLERATFRFVRPRRGAK